jgi:hypothetical protein
MHQPLQRGFAHVGNPVDLLDGVEGIVVGSPEHPVGPVAVIDEVLRRAAV